MRRASVFAFGLGTLVVALTGPIAGQVGHQPERSPYRDLRIKQSLTGFGGLLSGGRGKAGVGPADGTIFGVRWDIHTGSAATLVLGVSAADLERRLINPSAPPSLRDLGTARQTVWVIDGGFNLVLTGRKTWHTLAPYLGASLGAAVGGSVPEDSVFSFRGKFQFGPMLGVRQFLNRRLHLRVEFRDIIWRLGRYPDVFFTPGTGVEPVLDPDVNSPNEWVHHPTLFFALGWTLRL